MTETQKLRRFTKDELMEFNGENGKPVYVAYKGKVYDVSSSRLWSTGKHQARHSAGNDLTESILNAPHNEKVLGRFQVVGELFEEEGAQSKLVRWFQKLHFHPISVHFSIAYSIAVSLLSVLYLLTGKVSLETAAYYMLFLGLLSAPVTAATGLYTWRTNYKSKRNKIFSRKQTFAVVFLAFIITCFSWRTLNPQILTARTDFSFVYLLIVLCLTPIVTILGYYGGKIVYS